MRPAIAKRPKTRNGRAKAWDLILSGCDGIVRLLAIRSFWVHSIARTAFRSGIRVRYCVQGQSSRRIDIKLPGLWMARGLTQCIALRSPSRRKWLPKPPGFWERLRLSDHASPTTSANGRPIRTNCSASAPTAGLRGLRARHAALIRRFKPEHYPQQFRRIRDAYETLEWQVRWRERGDPPDPADVDDEITERLRLDQAARRRCTGATARRWVTFSPAGK